MVEQIRELQNLMANQYKRIVQALQITSLCLIAGYYVLATFIPDYQKVYGIQIVIPRCVYVILGLTFTLGRWKCNEKERIGVSQYEHQENHIRLQFTNGDLCLIQLLLLVVGPNSVMAFVLIYMSLRLINCYFLHLNPHSVLYPIMIGLVSYFGYFCTGHSNQVTDIQVSQGFIGFYEFNLFISGSLVLLNTMSTFSMGIIALKSYSREAALQVSKGKVEDEEFKILSNRILLKNSTITLVLFIGGFIGVSVNNMINYNSLLLIYDFAPKYLIDTSIYFFVICTIFCIQICAKY